MTAIIFLLTGMQDNYQGDGGTLYAVGSFFVSEVFRSLSFTGRTENQTLFQGMTMKLAVAVALSHHPQLLILDEATSGLDPIMREEMLDVFFRVCAG